MMRSGVYSGRIRWWLTAIALLVASLAVLAVMVWFFYREGRVKSDQWSSILGFGLAFSLAVVSLLVWLFRKAAGSDATVYPPAAQPPGPTFNVRAGRDAYTAQTQTFYQDGRGPSGEREAAQ